jgi:hypothetical protein
VLSNLLLLFKRLNTVLNNKSDIAIQCLVAFKRIMLFARFTVFSPFLAYTTLLALPAKLQPFPFNRTSDKGAAYSHPVW